MSAWKRDDTLSTRARQNARDAERAAVDVLVDVSAGAFAGSETLESIGRAMESLAEAYRISQQRWREHLDSFHQERAA